MTTDRAVLAARLLSLVDVDDPTASLDRLLALVGGTGAGEAAAQQGARGRREAVVRAGARPGRGCAGDAARGWAEHRCEAHARLLLDDPAAQVAATRQALDLATASPDPFARRWRASLLTNLGCALVDAGSPGEAPTVQLALLEELHADGIDDVHVARELDLLSRPDAGGWHSG